MEETIKKDQLKDEEEEVMVYKIPFEKPLLTLLRLKFFQKKVLVYL